LVPSGHEHNGSELMLVAPRWKHLAFTFGSSLGSGDLQNIRNAQQPQLANLPCARILVREPSADELVVFSTRRVGKNRNARCNAAVHEVRRFERPTTSAHPAPRRTGSRMEGTATMAAAANATTATIGARPGRRELMLGFISNFHVGTWRAINFETTGRHYPDYRANSRAEEEERERQSHRESNLAALLDRNV
jgi:hypothetical protein